MSEHKQVNPCFYSRRAFLKAGSAVMTLMVTPLAFGADSRILAVRVWPSQDYTRITLESKDVLRYTQQIVKDPERLVIDLEGVELNSVIESLSSKVLTEDPYIKLIRAGRNRPGVVRLVVELKAEINPQTFNLMPVGEYGNRLVVDLYPAHATDPLMALIEKPNPQTAAAGEPSDLDRLLNLARDEPQMVHAADTQDPIAQLMQPTQQAQAAQPVQPAQPTPLQQPARTLDASTAKVPGSKRNVDRLITVTIDPGHGGEDPGAIGAAGNYEKNVVLQIAKRLKAKIDAEPNMRCMLTRDSDFFVPLGMRVEKARRVQADLFMSIHADAFVRPEARGSSVFILSDRGASSTAAKWLAAKENASDLIGGVNLSVKDSHLAKTLLDLSQTATLNDSAKFAKAVLSEVGGINTLHKAAVEQAGFAVLKAPDIPSILVETAFISNPEEEKRLIDDAYQDKMADALLRGIKQYFAKNPPLSKSKMAML